MHPRSDDAIRAAHLRNIRRFCAPRPSRRRCDVFWRLARLDEADRELALSAAHARPGRFQIEAAIQSVHAERARTGHTDWVAIATFYDQLTRLAPSIGAAVARAAAHAEVYGAQAGLAVLDALSVVSYQPYWAVRADLLRYTCAAPTEGVRATPTGNGAR